MTPPGTAVLPLASIAVPVCVPLVQSPLELRMASVQLYSLEPPVIGLEISAQRPGWHGSGSAQVESGGAGIDPPVDGRSGAGGHGGKSGGGGQSLLTGCSSV